MLIPGTITINFEANFTGNHRVCWRIKDSGNEYVCTNIVSCSGEGATCTAMINILREDSDNNPTIYEGYIQATCNDESSSSGRVPFEVTYTPVV